MNAIWEYKITEAQRINRAAGFSDHLNQMGTERWELVTVETFKDVGVNIFYWKRPLVSSTPKVDKNFRKIKQNADNLSTLVSSTAKSVVSPFTIEAPSPVFASIVHYVVIDGFMSQMLAEGTSAPSLEAVYQHTIQSGEDEILNVKLVPDLSDMITKEESRTNWLDTVEHMFVKFQNGSRTDACSGQIIHYWFSQ